MSDKQASPGPTSFRQRPSRARRLALALGVFVGALVLAETALRLANVPERTCERVRIAGFPGEHATALKSMAAHPTRWWALAPALSNSRRMLGHEFATPKPPGCHRIVVLGDSVSLLVMGPGQSLTDATEARLHDMDPSIEVVNASCMGYSTAQAARWWDEEGAGWEADLVVLATGWNDIYRPIGASDLFWQQRTDMEWSRLGLLAFDALCQAPAADRRVPADDAARLAAHVASVARERGAKFAWVTLPIGPDHARMQAWLTQRVGALAPGDSFEERLHQRRAAVTAAVGDPIDWESEWAHPDAEWFGSDQIHLTPAGVERASEWLAGREAAVLLAR